VRRCVGRPAAGTPPIPSSPGCQVSGSKWLGALLLARAGPHHTHRGGGGGGNPQDAELLRAQTGADTMAGGGGAEAAGLAHGLAALAALAAEVAALERPTLAQPTEQLPMVLALPVAAAVLAAAEPTAVAAGVEPEAAGRQAAAKAQQPSQAGEDGWDFEGDPAGAAGSGACAPPNGSTSVEHEAWLEE